MNYGVAFSLWQGIPVWIIGVVLVGLMIYAVKMRELWGRVGVILMLVGGCGNLIQRIVYGGVVDNWNFLGLFYNNVWDYLIVGGVLIVVYQGFRRKI